MNILNLENEKFKTVQVKGYEFKIRFMSPEDRYMIMQQRSMLQNGKSYDSLSAMDLAFLENVAMVNICVEELPKGFKQNESCLKWMDIELINMVADEIEKHSNEIQEKLKKNKPIEGGV